MRDRVVILEQVSPYISQHRQPSGHQLQLLTRSPHSDVFSLPVMTGTVELSYQATLRSVGQPTDDCPEPIPHQSSVAQLLGLYDSAKDNITKDNEVTDHSVCDQDHPNGQEHDSTKNEIKIEADSQSSYMETEELSPNQEDDTIVEQPEVIPLTDDQEDKEGEKAQGEDTPRVPVQSEGSGYTENSPSPD
ncbi:PREDICTED: O-acetyl-ADP-ribose deacetylase MACROD2-like, partial [Odobenus rosmarus divergens]|uniref:O-acetyl-ADP-ribose deacetylase MACROD2-like n=1 Tax=Odobenus rosmarus divergens TaxID=9708 RepID=A0A9B0HAM6_ODORO